ncbi:MAG: hypothetical protein ABJN34_02360 [Litoreibacter sp.]|uniref:hypothetical protein n=1 Tax=Litoreibacter sp. TaxID=1969459 RepID=UPI003296CB94
MEKVVVEQLIERVSALLREKLGIRGVSLEARVRRAGRSLPRHVRHAAKELVNAESMSHDPLMLRRLDGMRISAAYDICVKHLDGIDEKANKSKAVFGFAATFIVQIFVIAGIAIAVMKWRGLI